ncbi:MAG: response regulator transcription factor [Smithella sp.]|jgi:DNA-binding NarL/FixJ family response regulator
MIKLAVLTRDEKYLQQLINSLHGEKDISILSTMIIKNLESEVEQVLAFVKQMVELQPDMLLLDQGVLRVLAALDLEIIRGYRNKLPTMKIIIVGERYNDENVMAMIQGGVLGFFRIALGNEQLIKCIRVVDRGELWLDVEITTRVLKECIKEFMKEKDILISLTHLSSEKMDTLTPREMEVMALIIKSMTNEEIADKLFISPKTVKTHLRNIFAKAGVRNRVEAALLYTRHALTSH